MSTQHHLRHSNLSGFTLLELMIVVAILSILAATGLNPIHRDAPQK